MYKSLIQNGEEVARPKMKNSLKQVIDVPSTVLSKMPENVIHLEDVSGYLKSTFENVGEEHIFEEFNNIYNQDMSYQQGFEYLMDNDLVKFFFYTMNLIMKNGLR